MWESWHRFPRKISHYTQKIQQNMILKITDIFGGGVYASYVSCNLFESTLKYINICGGEVKR